MTLPSKMIPRVTKCKITYKTEATEDVTEHWAVLRIAKRPFILQGSHYLHWEWGKHADSLAISRAAASLKASKATL